MSMLIVPVKGVVMAAISPGVGTAIGASNNRPIGPSHHPARMKAHLRAVRSETLVFVPSAVTRWG
jgi:hypothetical protein